LEGRVIKNVFEKHRAKQIDVLVGKTMYCVNQDATKKPHATINKYLYIIFNIVI
jgi:hypothetical protein